MEKIPLEADELSSAYNNEVCRDSFGHACLSAERCLWPKTPAQLFLQYRRPGVCWPSDVMQPPFNRLTHETLREVLVTELLILPTLVAFLLAHVCAHKLPPMSVRRSMVEFLVIVPVAVTSFNVASAYLPHFLIVSCIVIGLWTWHSDYLRRAPHHEFEFGARPTIFTLTRATGYLLTAVCILAVDFENFPHEFRKSRRYGATIMDTGIGSFVLMMGTVSRRPRGFTDIFNTAKAVAPVILIGALRTLVIRLIDYHQDEHEYGVHMNAFFTLGITKFVGTIVSGLARTDWQLLPIAVGLGTIHQIGLSLGISDFVMDDTVERSTFFTANREGLCSLPGFITMYLIQICISSWMRSKEKLSYKEVIQKFRLLSIGTICSCLLTIASVYTLGISRVTCNLGYVIWTIAVLQAGTLVCMLFFTLLSNVLLPRYQSNSDGSAGDLQLTNFNQKLPDCPVIVRAINQNGLVFFMLANFVTGFVNIFLKPKNRSDFESVLILFIHILVPTVAVYFLYQKQIRIA